MTPLFVHGHQIVREARVDTPGWHCITCGEWRRRADAFEDVVCDVLRIYARAVATHAKETKGHLPVRFAANLAALAGATEKHP